MNGSSETEAQLIEELRNVRRQQHALLDSTSDAIITTDLDSVIQSWNRAAEALYGWSTEEAIGRRVGELVPTEYDDRDDDALATLLAEGTGSGEVVQTRKDGTRILVHTSTDLVKDDAGHPTHVVSINRDITERKQMEEALDKRRAFYDAVLECIVDGIVTCDQDGKLTYFNRAMCEFHRLPAEPIPPEEWPNHYDLYEPDGKTPLAHERVPLFRAWKGEEVTGQELVVVAKGLPARTLISTGRKLIDSSGNPIGAVVSLHDITERKQMEEKLVRAEAEWQATFDATNDAVFVLDQDHRVLRSNRKAEGVFQRPCSEVIGKHCCEIVHGTASPLPGCPFVRARDSLLRETLELRVDDHSWLQVTVDPILDASGRFAGAVHVAADITERKRAAEALQEMNDILEASTAVVFLWRNEEGWPADHVSHNVSKLFGHTAEDFCTGGISYSNVIHPDDLERVETEVATFSAEGTRTHFEHEPDRIVTKDGSVKWVDDRMAIRRDAAGRITHYQGIVLDITAHKRAEEELSRSNERFQLAFEIANIAICLVDLDQRFIAVNNQMCNMFGYTKEEFESMGVKDITHPEDLDIAPQFIQRASSGEIDNQRLIKRYVHKQGRPIWGEVSSVIVRSDQDVPAFFISYVLDITDRKQAEEALRLKDLVFETSVAASNITDPEGVITDVNQAFLETWGYSGRDEVIGMPAVRLLLREEDALEIGGILRVSDTWSGDYVARRKDGSTFVAMGHATALRETTGELLGYHQSVIDVTERRSLQASLAQSDRLTSRGMLAAGVAHEINNPLSYVLYNLESMAEDLPRLLEGIRSAQAEQDALDADGATVAPDESDKAVSPWMLEDLIERTREAGDGARRIRDIARGLGAFSRVERDELIPLDLHAAIEHAINMCFNEIKYRARLVKDFRPVPTILASEGRLAQVVLNLLVNAAHAIDEGDVEHNEIRIRTWSEGDDAFFEVRDTGKGIPPKDLDQLFEPFFTTKPVGVGSGLGLSICKSIVSGYDGEIAVKSKVGEGTSLTVRLPIRRAETGQVETHGAAEPAADPAERGRILVVDDEAPIRSILKRLLGTHHEIVTAKSGAAAQELLERDRSFDLIICDMMMPMMSGMDLHKWLVETDPDLAENLLFITGGAFTPKSSEYMAGVKNLQVEKPFNSRDLRRLVSGLVAAAKSKKRQSA